jgi:hypothetical protein
MGARTIIAQSLFPQTSDSKPVSGHDFFRRADDYAGIKALAPCSPAVSTWNGADGQKTVVEIGQRSVFGHVAAMEVIDAEGVRLGHRLAI